MCKYRVTPGACKGIRGAWCRRHTVADPCGNTVPMFSPTWNYIKSIMKTNVEHLSFVDFFAHNDMDMMEIGNGRGNLTIQEERTHFAVWAFMKSPILLGTDVCGPPILSLATPLSAIIGHVCSFLNSPLRRSRSSRTESFSRSTRT